jgi:hypothetical protein
MHASQLACHPSRETPPPRRSRRSRRCTPSASLPPSPFPSPPLPSPSAWSAAADAGRRILIEGANATMLDLDFGTYPFVTSSNPSLGGIATGLGLAPTRYSAVIGVVSAPVARLCACIGWPWCGVCRGVCVCAKCHT